MADIDPLGIINSGTQMGPDGVPRRANEKVTRNYMQFGKYFQGIYINVQILPHLIDMSDSFLLSMHVKIMFNIMRFGECKGLQVLLCAHFFYDFYTNKYKAQSFFYIILNSRHSPS